MTSGPRPQNCLGGNARDPRAGGSALEAILEAAATPRQDRTAAILAAAAAGALSDLGVRDKTVASLPGSVLGDQAPHGCLRRMGQVGRAAQVDLHDNRARTGGSTIPKHRVPAIAPYDNSGASSWSEETLEVAALRAELRRLEEQCDHSGATLCGAMQEARTLRHEAMRLWEEQQQSVKIIERVEAEMRDIRSGLRSPLPGTKLVGDSHPANSPHTGVCHGGTACAPLVKVVPSVPASWLCGARGEGAPPAFA